MGPLLAAPPRQANENRPVDEGRFGQVETVVAITEACPREVEQMLWTTPKVVEISCGLEINSYVRAEL